MRMHSALTITILLVAASIAAAAPYEVDGAQIVAENARFTVLSDTLVRVEYAPDGRFIDEPSALVQDRDWPPCSIDVSEEGEWLVVKTDALELRWRMGSAPFSNSNLMVSWWAGGKAGTWRPGKEDRANLGGTRGALDGIGRGNLPPLDEGLLSREGWTLLDDSQRPLWLGEEGWLQDRPDAAARDWYFFAYGNDYARMLGEYVQLCGRIPMLPRYVWGTWYSRYWAYSDEELRDIVGKFRELDIPLDVLVIDVDWHHYGWEGYDWNEQFFPDPEGFLQWVHDQGVYVTLNNHPGNALPVEDSHHAAAAEMAGLTGEDLAKPLGWDLADPKKNRAFVEAVHWPLEQIGVDFWWIDGNPPAHQSGLSATVWCAKTYYDGTQRRTGNRSLVFSRYGGLGQHRYPTGFSGDVHSQWDVLNYEVRFTSRAGNVAFPYWSHDIGGFFGDRLDPELYVRWCQFGALSPVNRLHSNHGVREPWEYGEEAEEIVRQYFKLRQRLYPYLNTCQREVYETGMPLCRAMYMHWPEREEAYHYDYQYMLGPSLLVAPITMSAGGDEGEAAPPAVKEMWIPPGLWWDYWTGEPLEGPRTILYQASLDRCPMFVKAGAIIPMQADMDFMGQKPADKATIDVWPGADGEFSVYEDDGLSLDYQHDAYAVTPIALAQDGEGLNVSIAPRVGAFAEAVDARAYAVVVHGVAPPTEVKLNGKTVTPGDAVSTPEARALRWEYDANASTVTVRIPQTSVDEVLSLTLATEVSPDALATRARLRAAKACAQNALRLARDLKLEADRAEKIELVISAADAGAEASVAEALRNAWPAIAASGLPERARHDILRKLAGLSTSAHFWPVERSEDREVRLALGTGVALPGATAQAVPVLPPDYSISGAVRSTLGDLADALGGTLSYRVASARPHTPSLGLMRFGAEFTLEFAGVSLPLSARVAVDYSFVQQWHLIGPFSNKDRKGLETEFPPEREIDFSKSYPGLEGRARWQTTQWQMPAPTDPTAFINLEHKFRPKDDAIAYAVAYIIAGEEKEAVLSIGTDDGCKVWLNGDEILYHPEARAPEPGQDNVEVTLKQGLNTVVYKVANEGGQWGLYLQVLGRDGKALDGLRTTLTPGGRPDGVGF